MFQTRRKLNKANLELPKAPISGVKHMTVERRQLDNGILIFRNGENMQMTENFYRPVVIQTKEKAIDKSSKPINMNERKIIDSVLGTYPLYSFYRERIGDARYAMQNHPSACSRDSLEPERTRGYR